MKISEIAKLAGVSIGTVDRVLHNRGRVAPQTKAKIEQIIKESGYKTNIIASNLKTGATLKIGLLIPMLNSEQGYWNKCYSGVQKAIDEISAFSVEIITEEFDRQVRGDLLNKGLVLKEKNIDVLALAPVVQSEAYQLISQLDNIQYAFFDSPLKNASPITENLQDPYAAGRCSGRLMELFKPGKNIFISLQMHNTAYNQQRRAQGFIDYFNDKEATVLNYTWQESSDLLFFSFVDSLLLEYPNIAGIFMTNSATGQLAKYVASKKMKNHPCIVGFDLLDENVEQLKVGNIAALISQQPELQGYNTMQEIFRIKIMRLENTVPSSSIPISIILKENMPK